MRHTPTSLRPRHRTPALLLVTALLFCCTGCFTFETIVRINPDGSGTLEQTFSLTSEILQMAMMFGDEDSEPPGLCEEDKLREEATTMGAGVRLVSSEAIEEDERMGCKAVYAFDDINTLNVNLSPEDQMSDALGSDADMEEETTDEADFITFRFDEGSPSTLVVLMDQSPKDEDAQNQPAEDTTPVDDEQRTQQMQMMRQMFKGGRLAISLELAGTIAQTNATYREGGHITLFEIDFDRLLEDDEQLLLLTEANPKNPDEIKALLEDVDGIKIETNEEVTIRFQ